MTSFIPGIPRRFRLVTSLCLLAYVSGTLSASAQDDPFGFGGMSDSGAADFGGADFGAAGDAVFGVSPAPTTSASGANTSASETTDPLIRELRTLAGGSPEQLGLAIREAIRLKNWSEMELYLGGGRVLGRPEPEQLRIARRIGNLLLIRALATPDSNRPELQASSKQALQTLLEVARNNAVATTNLDAAVKQLLSDDRNEQLGAVRVLKAGGEESVRRVIAAALSEQSKPRLARLVELLGSFGESGYEAIELVAMFGTDELRPSALRVANQLDSRKTLPAALAAIAAGGSTESERQVAADILTSTLGGIPSRAEIEKFLADRLEAAEAKLDKTAPSENASWIWRVTDDRQSVEMMIVPGRAAAARRAAEVAELLRRVGPSSPTVFLRALGADLRNRFLSDPIYGSSEDLTKLKTLWGPQAADPNALSAILDKALGSKMVSSQTADPDNTTIGDPLTAIAAIRMLAAIGDASVVDGVGNEFAALVKGASHGIPQVRYEAAAAIEQLHPQKPYVGSSTVLERWIEMSLLENAPKAIVLVNELAKRLAIEQRLSLLGYRFTEVSSVAELIREVDLGGDIELIVATSRPPDYSAIEMIDRVRRRPLGGAAPMIIVDGWPAGYEQFGQRWRAANVLIAAEAEPVLDMSVEADLATDRRADLAADFAANEIAELDGDYSVRSRKVAAHTAVVDLAGGSKHRRRNLSMTPRETVKQLQLALIDLAETESLPAMTAADRQIYAFAGLTALSRLIEDPDTSAIYDWKSKEAELAEASRRTGYSEASLRILSATGTPYSQDLLARVALTPQLAFEKRQLAATAFSDSISAAGTRISRRQILSLYDRYNQSRDDDTRKVLGIILDAIEARAEVANP